MALVATGVQALNKLQHRLIQGPVHPSFGLVNCTLGRVYPSNRASWTGNTRPRCTEYDRASTSFRRYCASAARLKLPHAQVSLAKPCYDQSHGVPPRAIGRGTGSLWNAALSYNTATTAYYYRWLDYSGDHYSSTNNQLKQPLLLAYIY